MEPHTSCRVIPETLHKPLKDLKDLKDLTKRHIPSNSVFFIQKCKKDG